MRLRRLLSWEEAALLLWVVAVHAYVATASVYTLLNWFHIDDAFYYFTVARNIVLGRGVTFDGLGPTNGFHPLWMALLVGVYALLGRGGDLILPLRGIVVLTGLLHGLTGVVLYRAGRLVFHRLVAWSLAVAWALGVSVVQAYSVGSIESALNGLTLAGLWWATLVLVHAARPRTRHWVAWGLALSMAMLARLDNVFVALAITLAVLFHHRGMWASWLRRRAWAPLMRWGLVWTGPPLLLVGGYLLWSWAYVGGVVPVSAQVKAWWGTFGQGTPYGRPKAGAWPWLVLKANLDPRPGKPWAAALAPVWEAYHRLEGVLTAWGLPRVRSWQEGLPLALAGLALAIGVVFLTRRVWGPVVRRAWVLPWLVGSVVHASYYTLARHMAVRGWYWVGQTLLVYIMAAAAVQALAETPAVRTRLARVGRAVSTWLMPGLMLGLLLVVGLRLNRFIARRFPHERPGVHMYLDYARWVEAHTEPGALVGATGAGSLGYFVQGRTIVNLDGLISNYAYVEAMKHGRRVAYLRAVGLDYALIGRALYDRPPYQDLTPYLEEVARYYNETEQWGIVLRRFRPPAQP